MSDYARVSHEGKVRWARLAGGEAVLLDRPPWEEPQPATGATSLEATAGAGLPPVAPSKIVCFGRNYAAHAIEQGAEVPKQPLLFLKAPSSLAADGSAVPLPPESERVECEGELALVISRRLRRFRPDQDPADYIFGCLAADDVTARDLQRAEKQWARGKSFDGFCPVGPRLRQGLPEPDALLKTRVNGTPCQEASLAQMMFPIGELLAWASAAMTLEPGDLILTGTPEGVERLAPGDEVEVEIEGLPILRHGVVTEG
jgi:2-keto-4-pentenoate hydratase/2-oxohepta-3-ene-1,7-dioic acid hydratase in catechol pathway